MPIQFNLYIEATGETATYHVIERLDVAAKPISVGLISYLTVDAYNAGKDLLAGSNYTFDGPIVGEPIAWAEQQIVARPEWQGATVV